MKLAAVAAVAAGAVAVSATPLRVIYATPQPPAEFTAIRMGHAVPAANPSDSMVAHLDIAHPNGRMRKPCGGMSRIFKQKSIDIANKFRQAFGFPLIEDVPVHHGHHGHPEPHFHGMPDKFANGKLIHGGMIQVIPATGGPGTFVKIGGPQGHEGHRGWWGTTKGGEPVEIRPGTGPHHGHAHAHDLPGEVPPGAPMRKPCGRMRRPRPHLDPNSFLVRFQTAIMSLGPWEGRAVAFVIGAGIGVLLRMFWVLGVVAYRGFSGKETSGYSAVEDSDDEDEVVARRTPISAPPAYVYPIDEKVEVDGSKATGGN